MSTPAVPNKVAAIAKPILIGAVSFLLAMIVYDLYRNWRDKRAIAAAAAAVPPQATA
jgi:hypothetical protein